MIWQKCCQMILLFVAVFWCRVNKGGGSILVRYIQDIRIRLITFDKYLVVVLQLLGTSCLCYNNNCITKLWYSALTFSIYTWFSWHCFLHSYKLKFIILNSYEYLKLVELSPQLNSVESFRAHFSSNSSISFHPSLKSSLSIVKSYHIIY